MEIIVNSALRATILYITLLILARIMGKKMFSQMTFFDFVVGIVSGKEYAERKIHHGGTNKLIKREKYLFHS